MKIVYMITRADWGGAQAHLYDLISYNHHVLQADCSLLIGEEGRLTDEVRKLGINVVVIKELVRSIHPIKDFVAVRKIARLLQEISPDLIHLHSSKAGIVGRIAAKLAGVPAVFTAHGWAFTEGVSLSRRLIALPLEKVMAYCSEKIICVSDYDKRLALNYKIASPDKLVTIHNGIPPAIKESDKDNAAKLQTLLSFDKNTVACVMVARFSEQKDHRTLLKAFSMINSDISLKLFLIGQGPFLDATQELAKELGISERVHFMGPRTDVEQLLPYFNIFLLITNYEGFPISILEAMRVGLPVIATNVGGVNEAVVNGETGFTVPRGDANAIKNHLEHLAKDSVLRKDMGKKGRGYFLAHFTSEKMLEETSHLYQGLLMRKYNKRKVKK